MKDKTLADLVQMMEYQFPGGITTWGPCGNGCGGLGRGGGACRYCLAKEIDSRTENCLGSKLLDSLREKRTASFSVEAIKESILDVK